MDLLKKSFFKIWLSAFFLIFDFVFCACQYYSYGLDEFLYRDNSIRNRSSKLKELDEGLENSVFGSYEILVITDVHFGGEGIGHNGERRDDEFFSWISENFKDAGKEMPKFCVCLGDVAEHGLESEFKDYKKFTEKLESEFGIKTYNIIGNHDLYNAGWKNFEKYSFPYCSFYKFRTKNLTYYFLDSVSQEKYVLYQKNCISSTLEVLCNKKTLICFDVFKPARTFPKDKIIFMLAVTRLLASTFNIG